MPKDESAGKKTAKAKRVSFSKVAKKNTDDRDGQFIAQMRDMKPVCDYILTGSGSQDPDNYFARKVLVAVQDAAQLIVRMSEHIDDKMSLDEAIEEEGETRSNAADAIDLLYFLYKTNFSITSLITYGRDE